MEDFVRNYQEELRRLDVQEGEEVTAKMLSMKFKKLALKTHPDKTGDVDNDAEFKNLLNDYNMLIDALSKMKKDEVEQEKNYMADFFAQNNIAKENTQSYTILVEKANSTEWKNELKKMDLTTVSKKLACGGFQYKIKVLANIISMTHYENPSDGQAKLHIQGSKYHCRIFIINNLPEMYKRVSDKAKKKEASKDIVKKKQAVVIKSLSFACTSCDNEYARQGNLAKHIASKHTKSVENVVKNVKKKPNKTQPSLSIEAILITPQKQDVPQLGSIDLTESQKLLVIPDADLTSDLATTDSEDEHDEETNNMVSDILTELVNTPQKKPQNTPDTARHSEVIELQEKDIVDEELTEEEKIKLTKSPEPIDENFMCAECGTTFQSKYKITGYLDLTKVADHMEHLHSDKAPRRTSMKS